MSTFSHKYRHRVKHAVRRTRSKTQTHHQRRVNYAPQDPFPPELRGINALAKRRGHFLVDATGDLVGYTDTWRRNQHQVIENQDASMAAMGMDEVARSFVHAEANMRYLGALRGGFGDTIADELLLRYLAVGSDDAETGA
jgi:hypothetical protein